mgnify:CR=1 FL=1|tara:strand:- start:266 stop:496 length:231 start_codon:yes stop_codon:yes gene_type:complete
MNNYLEHMIGKEVMLWPHMSYAYRAILLECNEYGFIFKNTTNTQGIKSGEVHFLSHSQGVKFKVYQPDMSGSRNRR